MRYGEQVYEIDVPLDGVDLAAPTLAGDLKRAFEARHEALYTYSLADQDPVLISARVTTVGVLPDPEEPEAPAGAPAAVGTRRIRSASGSTCRSTTSARSRGQVVEGPAIVESGTTTVLLRLGDRATTTAQRLRENGGRRPAGVGRLVTPTVSGGNEARCEDPMNVTTFVNAIRTEVEAPAVDDCLAQYRAPSGRVPVAALLEMSAWFEALTRTTGRWSSVRCATPPTRRCSACSA